MQIPCTNPSSLACSSALSQGPWSGKSEGNQLEAVERHQPRGNGDLFRECILPQNQEAPRGCETWAGIFVFFVPAPSPLSHAKERFAM